LHGAYSSPSLLKRGKSQKGHLAFVGAYLVGPRHLNCVSWTQNHCVRGP
jgi:hypothetical protein